jgi:S1-C subfamily serine protease
MRVYKIILLIIFFILSIEAVESEEQKAVLSSAIKVVHDPMIKNSIVKIFTVANKVDFEEPWSSHVEEFSGSGCIISGQRILTNAHVVTDATYVEVLKNGETKRYEAEVLSIDHEADLALVTVKDKSFFKGTKSLKIGKLPELQKEVNVYGFPMGGDTLSITKGVVSRIEHQSYAHSNKMLMAIQIDAAINYGNSGGPALADGKVVGLVMQGNSYGEGMGYIIPASVINHYLEDMKDKKYDGYPYLGLKIQDLESPVMKEMYGLKGKKYGVLVTKTIPNSPASRVFKTGDILISIDNYMVYSNYKVEFRKKEFTHFIYVVDQHQLGDKIKFKILRDGKEKKFTVTLDKKENDLMLMKKREPETKLSYYIYGGLVFVPGLTEYYLPPKFYNEYPDEEREELVVLKRVLSSSLTKGYGTYGLGVVHTINGKKFRNFKEFVKIIEHSSSKFIVFADEDNYQMVVNRKAVLKSKKEILEKYNIKAAMSDDLKEK